MNMLVGNSFSSHSHPKRTFRHQLPGSTLAQNWPPANASKRLMVVLMASTSATARIGCRLQPKQTAVESVCARSGAQDKSEATRSSAIFLGETTDQPTAKRWRR